MRRMRKILVSLLVFAVIVAAIPSILAIDLSPIEAIDMIDESDNVLSSLSLDNNGSKKFLSQKMDAAMNRVVENYNRKQGIKAMTVSNKEKCIDAQTLEIVDGRVKAYLDLENKESVADMRAKYDLANIITTSFSEIIQVNVLVKDLERLAEESAVRYIMEPDIGVMNTLPDIENISSVMESKAVAEIQADKLHRMGITGKDVKTAVIDGGFYRYADNPEINNVEEVKSFRSDSQVNPGDESHGVITSEIYSDISYGNLSLYTVETGIEFAKAIEYIIEKGDIKVIFSCFYFFEGMPRETSISSKAVDKARDNGILAIISSGNFQKQYYESEFVDTDGDGWHEFNNPGEKIDETQRLGLVTTGEYFDLHLNWLDTNQNLDLYVIEETDQMNIIDFSSGNRAGVGQADKSIRIKMKHDAFLHIAIYSNSENSVTNSTDLGLFATRDLQYISSTNSVTSPAAAKGAISIGAVEPGTREIQYYSSCGKVNFVGISPVITWATEPNFFDGTSASTPSVAGAIALLMSACPTATNEQILLAIKETAIDLGEKGWDPIYGNGLPQVLDAYERLKEILENQ